MPASRTQLKARCERLKPDDEPTAYATDTAMITTMTKEESESVCSGMAPLDNAMDNNSRSDCHRLAEDSMNMRCWASLWLRGGGFTRMGTWRDRKCRRCIWIIRPAWCCRWEPRRQRDVDNLDYIDASHLLTQTCILMEYTEYL